MNQIPFVSTLCFISLINVQIIFSSSIVGGKPVPTCGWPTVVYINVGCTGTLIHPKAISTAQHCDGGEGVRYITFGDRDTPSYNRVDIVRCIKEGSEDAMICELAEAVTDIPVTPVLYGCEVEKYMIPGQDVVLAGFGRTDRNANDYGTKHWVTQKITAVHDGYTVIGDGGDDKSPCNGDSGGPVFLKASDGGWRVFGTVWRGTTSIMCNSAANLQRIDPVVPHFEKATGLDITPCFDGITGAWEPSENCAGFFAGSEATHGSWDNMCTGTPVSQASAECGVSMIEKKFSRSKPENQVALFSKSLSFEATEPINHLEMKIYGILGTEVMRIGKNTRPEITSPKRSWTFEWKEALPPGFYWVRLWGKDFQWTQKQFLLAD